MELRPGRRPSEHSVELSLENLHCGWSAYSALQLWHPSSPGTPTRGVTAFYDSSLCTSCRQAGTRCKRPWTLLAPQRRWHASIKVIALRRVYYLSLPMRPISSRGLKYLASCWRAESESGERAPWLYLRVSVLAWANITSKHGIYYRAWGSR
jgi:hypothetical protein